MKRTAVGWLAWQLTESPAWLGIIAFADLLPTVVLAIVAGAISDRFGIMRIMRLSQVLAAMLSLLFGALIMIGWIDIYITVVLTLLFGAIESMGQPARMSAVHAVVPQRDLSSAIALTSASFNAARIVGPGIAGALILWSNAGVVIALCAATFLAFYLVLLKLDFGTPRDGGTKSPKALLEDIRFGIVYAFGRWLRECRCRISPAKPRAQEGRTALTARAGWTPPPQTSIMPLLRESGVTASADEQEGG
jgi:MFS family permease